MDEILATVRRIIAEDEKEPGAPSTGRGAGNGASKRVASGLGGGAADDEAGDDVLELTEAINADGSTRHLSPVGSAVRREPGWGASPPVAPSPVAPPPEAELQRGAAPGAEREFAVVGGRTIEDVVSDLLRPLLQSWLDENLPEIVERLVRAEIARVVDKSGVV